MQPVPYDVTPGFVVKQTFLELEPDTEEEVPALRRRASDSLIHFPPSTATALYGATANRVHSDSIKSLSDSAEDSTDSEPTPITSRDKRDSLGSSATSSELRSSVYSFSHEQRPTSSQEVTAAFRTDLICHPSDESDSASNAAEEPVVCISIGSQCHPGGCGRPCKYNTKKKGCKDGEACTFCHLCKWKPDKTRGRRRRSQKAQASAEARGTAEAAESADATDDEAG